MQTRDKAPVKVIDVSHWNTVSSWQSVKDSNVAGVYVKATQGADYVDPTFINNVRGAQSVGLPVGAYHYLEHGMDAKTQARHFLQIVDEVHLDLMLALDVEDPGITEDEVRTFIEELNRPILFYSYTNYIAENNYKNLKDLPLWIANYGDITNPPNVGGWTKFVMWQYSQSGSIPGIQGSVDLNAATSLTDLLAAESVDLLRTTMTDLNIRTGPGTQYALADAPIPKGKEIHLDELYGDWAHTTWGTTGGWVSRHYLTKTESEK